MTRVALALCALLAPQALAAAPTPQAVPTEPAPQTPATPQATADYRATLMGATKHHMKAVSEISQGKVARPQDLPGHARALHDIARSWSELFPAGTGPDQVKTETLAAVWTQPDAFKRASEGFQSATAALLAAAEKGDTAAVGEAVTSVRGACKSCHDSFRKDD